MEKIEVFTRPSQLPGNPGNHMWMVYTRSDGAQFSMSGWSNTTASILTGFGTLDTQVTNWGPNSWDWAARTTSISTFTIQNNSLASNWSAAVQAAVQIDYANLQYGPLLVNSNAVINTALIAGGLPQVPNDTDNPLSSAPWTPGGSVNLKTLFDLSRKYLPDEIDAPTIDLRSYQPGFGGGGGGGVREGGGGYGGGSSFNFGGSSGRFVRVGVGEEGGTINYGWRWIEATATRIKPVVLDLDGDGVELTSAESSPGFDFFGAGYAKTMGWFTGGDAVLVHDANGNGKVDNGTEISFIHHSPTSTSDLQALRVFDTNQNGWLDPGDFSYSQFHLWKDDNFNAVNDPGELLTLNQLGVQSINLQGSGGGYEVAGNAILGTSTFVRTDGSSGTAYDVGFKAFDRGTRFISENADWAILATDGGEEIAVLRHDGPVYINNLARLEVNGDMRTGYQLGDAADTVLLQNYGDYRFYLDTAGGDDHIDLGSSTGGSVIKAGAGNDAITAGYGDDFITTGQGYYDVIRDRGGNDYFFIQSDNSAIYDHSGSDVAVFERLSFSNVEFYWEGGNLVVASRDGSQRHFIMDMYTNPDMAIEYAMFTDRTLGQAELVALADAGGYRDSKAPLFDPGNDLSAAPFITMPELMPTEFYG